MISIYTAPTGAFKAPEGAFVINNEDITPGPWARAKFREAYPTASPDEPSRLPRGMREGLRALAALEAIRGVPIVWECPEAYQDPYALRVLLRAVLEAAREGVEIIISTHSSDVLEFFLELEDAEISQHLTFYVGCWEDDGGVVSPWFEAFEPAEARHFHVECGEDLRTLYAPVRHRRRSTIPRGLLEKLSRIGWDE